MFSSFKIYLINYHHHNLTKIINLPTESIGCYWCLMDIYYIKSSVKWLLICKIKSVGDKGSVQGHIQ